MVVVVAGTCGECVSGSWYGGCGARTRTHTHRRDGREGLEEEEVGGAANKKEAAEREEGGCRRDRAGRRGWGGVAVPKTHKRGTNTDTSLSSSCPQTSTRLFRLQQRQGG